MQTKVEAHRKIVSYTQRHEELSYREIAKKIGISIRSLQLILKAAGYTRKDAVTKLDLDTILGD